MTEGGDRPVKVRDTRCDRAFGLGCVTGRSRTSAAPGAGGAGGAGGGNGGGGGQFYPAHAIIAARGDTEQQLVRTPPHTLAYTHRQPRWRTATAVGAPRLRVQKKQGAFVRSIFKYSLQKRPNKARCFCFRKFSALQVICTRLQTYAHSVYSILLQRPDPPGGTPTRFCRRHTQYSPHYSPPPPPPPPPPPTLSKKSIAAAFPAALVWLVPPILAPHS